MVYLKLCKEYLDMELQIPDLLFDRAGHFDTIFKIDQFCFAHLLCKMTNISSDD